MSKARSNMAISCNSSLNVVITCVLVFFSVLTIKGKFAFLPSCIYLIKKFLLDVETVEENSGKTQLPAAFRIFLANQRGD